MAPFIAIETAAVVAAGDNTPRGEESGVSVPVVTMGSGRGLGTFEICGLTDISWVPVGETFVGVGMGVSKPPKTKIQSWEKVALLIMLNVFFVECSCLPSHVVICDVV